MSSYQLILPNEKIGTYRLVTLLVLLMNTAVFGYLLWALQAQVYGDLVFAGFLIGFFAVSMYWLKHRLPVLRSIRLEYALLALALVWAGIGNYFAAACSLCFGIMGFYTHRHFILKFSEAGIDYPSFPSKLISWKEVDWVMLKDGVLTLELAENKSIQAVIIPPEEVMEEEGFNQFCAAQISKAKD